jgi:CRP-like cAMP-binding protein
MPVERSQVLQLLKNIYLYRKLDLQQLGQVADAMQEVSFNAGQTIYEQGADAASFYLIYSGQVKIIRLSSRDEEHLHTHNPGDWFGEDGISLGQRRRTMAVALTSVVLLKLEAYVPGCDPFDPGFARSVFADVLFVA